MDEGLRAYHTTRDALTSLKEDITIIIIISDLSNG